jgi:hypothetical protein
LTGSAGSAIRCDGVDDYAANFDFTWPRSLVCLSLSLSPHSPCTPFVVLCSHSPIHPLLFPTPHLFLISSSLFQYLFDAETNQFLGRKTEHSNSNNNTGVKIIKGGDPITVEFWAFIDESSQKDGAVFSIGGGDSAMYVCLCLSLPVLLFARSLIIVFLALLFILFLSSSLSFFSLCFLIFLSVFLFFVAVCLVVCFRLCVNSVL